MNLRTIWTELFQKPTGRLILFLLTGAIVLAFILMGKGRKVERPNNADVPAQATTAKGYSFEEDIPPPPRTQPPASPRAVPDVPPCQQTAQKPPPPIPQAIYATKEPPRSENYLPFGRLLRCELVNTVDSTNIETPIIGLITEDVWHGGRLVLPAGTEVHGIAQKTAARERIGSSSQSRRV